MLGHVGGCPRGCFGKHAGAGDVLRDAGERRGAPGDALENVKGGRGCAEGCCEMQVDIPGDVLEDVTGKGMC